MTRTYKFGFDQVDDAYRAIVLSIVNDDGVSYPSASYNDVRGVYFADSDPMYVQASVDGAVVLEFEVSEEFVTSVHAAAGLSRELIDDPERGDDEDGD